MPANLFRHMYTGGSFIIDDTGKANPDLAFVVIDIILSVPYPFLNLKRCQRCPNDRPAAQLELQGCHATADPCDTTPPGCS